jgi:hypothetical protein
MSAMKQVLENECHGRNRVTTEENVHRMAIKGPEQLGCAFLRGLGVGYGRRLGSRYSEVNLTDVANDRISPQGV